MMSQRFSKSKILHFSNFVAFSKGGGIKNFGGTNLGGKKFGPLKSLVYNDYHIRNILDRG